jgi:surface carbohydrate biosynthesis protein
VKVAICIENKTRDLRGYTWLALHLAKHNHEVVFGETASIRGGLDVIEPNVWLRGGLSISSETTQIAKLFTNKGGILVLLETEGAIRGDEKYRKRLRNENSRQMSKYVDLHCTWGKHDAELLQDEISDYNVIKITGNPRFDLLTKCLRGVFLNESEKNKKIYDRYILILTNFTLANRDSEVPARFDEEWIRYHEKLISEYIDAIQHLASDLDCNIILRPHPRENITTYREQFPDTSNVHAIREGNVRPWILGAKAVIHTSSTAGIESALLGTPVFSYRPIRNETYDSELPILVSDEVTSYTDLSQILRTDLTDQSVSLSQDVKGAVRRDFHNFEDPVAAPLIAEAIDSLDNNKESVNITGINQSLETRLKRFGVQMFGGDFVESVGEVIFRTDRSGVRNKFPGLSAQELTSEIELIDRVSDESFPDVTVKKVPSLVNTFSIQPTD